MPVFLFLRLTKVSLAILPPLLEKHETKITRLIFTQQTHRTNLNLAIRF